MAAAVTQYGNLFRLSWTLVVDEDIEVRRTAPVAQFLATVEAGVGTFIDTIDTDVIDPGDTVTWTLTGVTSLDEIEVSITAADIDVPPLDDARRFQAVLLVASRLWKRRDAPFGVAGGGDFGATQIRRFDPDVQDLLVGLRRTGSDLTTQTWPTLVETRTFIGAGTAYTDDELQAVLDAATEIVKRRCRGAGIA